VKTIKGIGENVREYKRSIRWDIFFSSLLTALVVLVILGFFLYGILYRAELDKAGEVIRERNLALNYYVDGFVSNINDSIEILAADLQVQNGPYLDPAGKRALLERYKSYQWTNSDIAYIYSGYNNGLLIINDYTPPQDFNISDRPWYKAAVESSPQTSIGLPYREVRDGKWLLSTARAFPGGVVAIDASIDKLAILLEDRASKYETAYSLVISSDGEILIHNNERFLGKPVSSYTGNSRFLKNNEGRLDYTLEGNRKIAYYSRSDITDWYIMTVVNFDEIVSPLKSVIVPRLAAIALVAILLGIIQSYFLTLRFFSPIQNLYSHVLDIINGTNESGTDYIYPSNEIGCIASKLSSLAEKELYTMSQELKQANILLEEKNRELEILSSIDKLSGLYNRRKIDEELEKIHHMARRYGRVFCVLILDLDNFKTINDNHGHGAGDVVIREVGEILRRYLRPTDIAGRWGGEEFIIICPECNEKGLAALGNKILLLISDYRFSVESRVTASIGGASFKEKMSLEEILEQADTMLYKAKNGGRNRFFM